MALPLKPMFETKTEEAFSRTHPGMAHFAGTGPAGKTCRECKFYSNDGYYAASNAHNSSGLKPGRCAKYKELMRGQIGASLPHGCAACRHFEQHNKPPPAHAPGSRRFTAE